jgi:aspartate aminotransferase
MPKSSIRGLEIGASPIRSLLPHARAAKARGINIIHLNIGQPDIATPSEALAYLKQDKETIVSYGPSEGIPALRSAVARYYDKFEAQLTPEQVYVTTGASEAILFALLSCCDAGDEVIIPEPFYANYLGFSHMAGVKITPISTFIDSQFSLPSPAEFEQKITPETRAIILCNPSNPTGQIYTPDQLEAMAAIIKKHDLFLIVDEVYREFCYDKEVRSMLSFRGVEEHVIVIDSVSKVFSSCGARVGYLISKNEQFLATVNKYAQLRLCPPYHGQQLALRCYDNPEPYIAAARSEYRHRRQVLYECLSQIEGIKCYLPDAAFYNIIELPVPDAEAFCQWLLTEFQYEGSTVMFAPANGFYFNGDLGKSQVRLAYILQEKDIRRAMKCLELGLRQYLEEVVSAPPQSTVA